MTPQEWNEFVEKEAEKKFLQKDGSIGYCDCFKHAVQFVMDNLIHVPQVSELSKASKRLFNAALCTNYCLEEKEKKGHDLCSCGTRKAMNDVREALSKLRGGA